MNDAFYQMLDFLYEKQKQYKNGDFRRGYDTAIEDIMEWSIEKSLEIGLEDE